MKPVQPMPIPAGVRACEVVSHRDGRVRSASDWLAEEVPIALVLGGVSHAVMLASPSDLEDFALGFGLTEGLLADAGELLGVDVQPVETGIELRMEVVAACAWRLRERRRTLAGRTGCGLCGTDSLAQVRQALPALAPQAVAAAAINRSQHDLRSRQVMQQLTGATHAAAWCSLDGEPQLVREDVGRHNALDKLVGAMVRAQVVGSPGFIAITSRASFEMVQKCALAGVATLAAVSAPTALAVQVAQECGLLLVGFVRGDDLVAYTFAERLGQSAAPD